MLNERSCMLYAGWLPGLVNIRGVGTTAPTSMPCTLHLFPHYSTLFSTLCSPVRSLSSRLLRLVFMVVVPKSLLATAFCRPLLFPHWIAWELSNGSKEWRNRMYVPCAPTDMASRPTHAHANSSCCRCCCCSVRT